jgi:hypothetical protein
MLPGFILMLAAARLYERFVAGQTGLTGLLLGVQIVVVAIIIRAVQRIGAHVLEDRLLWMLAIGAFVASLLHAPFWIPLVACGLIYAMEQRPWAAAAIAAATRQTRLAEAVAAFVGHTYRVAVRHRASILFFVATSATDTPLRNQGLAANPAFAAAFAAAVGPFRDEIAHAKPEQAVDVAFRIRTAPARGLRCHRCCRHAECVPLTARRHRTPPFVKQPIGHTKRSRPGYYCP